MRFKTEYEIKIGKTLLSVQGHLIEQSVGDVISIKRTWYEITHKLTVVDSGVFKRVYAVRLFNE